MPTEAYEPRTYRTRMARPGLVGFRVAVKETDLWVLAARDFTPEVREVVLQERRQLEAYIARHPGFLTALTPWPDDPFAPGVVRDMITAAAAVGVGPMAAVAGALAARVGQHLAPLSSEVIVENGGDLYLALAGPATVALFAGKSPLSHRVGLNLDPALSPLGVCTSSATVGHSLSFGRADAACVLAASPALADAAATALGNRVQGPDTIAPALEWAAGFPDLLGAVVIVGEKLGAWGRVELVPLG
ncbi:MAG: UPF0280 family protein [Syntrophobacterales bacterium]|jgi:hypothetical protein|nr:UPF0280 family protein [Syntrophobacterales bacterium]